MNTINDTIMSQNFNGMFDRSRNENAVSKPLNNAHYRTHNTAAHVRNFCVTWPDGMKRFYNYAYLIDGSLSSEKTEITLHFTSKTIVLKGMRLGILLEDFLFNIPLEVIIIEERYAATVDPNSFVVTSIEIADNK